MNITRLIRASILCIFTIDSCAEAEAMTTMECPTGFNEFGNSCFITIGMTTYPFQCPLRYTEYSHSLFLLPSLAWMSTQRDTEYGFIQPPILHFSQEFLLWITTHVPNSDFSDCVTDNARLRRVVNCNNTYMGVCIYGRRDRQFCEAYDKICNVSQFNCHCQSKNILYMCQIMCVSSDHEECAICDEKFAQYPEPELQLTSFNGIERLRVDVIGPLKLISTSSQNRVQCFSNVYRPNAMAIRDRVSLSTLEVEATTRLTYSFPVNPLAVGLYWCEGLTYENHRKIVSNKIMAGIRPAYGLNFVLNFTMDEFTITPYNIHTQSETLTRSALLNDLNVNYQLVRLPELPPLYNNRSMADLSLHLTTYPHITNAENEYYQLSNTLSKCESVGFKNCSLALSDLCLPGITSVGSGLTASWSKAFLGQQIMPKEILLRENGLPITRRCIGSFMKGAYWSEIIGEVSVRRGSDVTNALHELIKANKTAEELNKALFVIISNAENMIPVDVYLVAKIFEVISQSGEDVNIHLLAENMNVIMEIDSNILQLAQIELNATDIILYSFDVALGALAGNTTTTIISKNIMAQVTPLGKSDGVRGVAVYHKTGEEMQLKNLTNVTILSDIDLDGLKLAVFIPPKLLREIFAQAKASNLVTTVFNTDVLFRSSKSDEVTVANAVAGVYVTNFFGVHLSEPLPIIFAPNYMARRSRTFCGFWKFGINDVLFAIHGRWQKEQLPKNYRNFKTCTFAHMTHFAILVNAPRNQVLDLISLVGCAISALAVLGIIITAMAFKIWRNCMATKILLNLSLTILIQMLLLFLSHVKSTAWWCTILAISLHYIILAQFFWMFVIGCLQYRKFVQVLVKEPPHLLVYSSMFAWLIPTFAVVATFFLGKSSYANPPYCFLSGSDLYFGVFLPIGCVVISNLTIFVIIFANLSCTKARAFGVNESTFLLRVKLSLILFFLMGFSWMFGLLAYFSKSIILSYMFCVTSTMQGFVLCVYFVMGNKTTRKFWAKHILCCVKDVREPSKTSSTFSSKFK